MSVCRFRTRARLAIVAALLAAGCSKTSPAPTLTLTYVPLGSFNERTAPGDTLLVPVAVAVRGDGVVIRDVWVAEASGRVTRFDFQGNFLSGFALPAGVFPVAVASAGDTLMDFLTASGEVWVTDTTGVVKTSYSAPAGVAATSVAAGGGKIFVGETRGGNGVIEVLDGAGRRDLALTGAGGDSLRSPGGLALHDSSLWVSDATSDRVKQFRTDGRFVQAFGSAGSGSGQMITPGGIVITDETHVLVVDEGNHRVLDFTAAGTIVTQITSTSLGNPPSLNIHAIARHGSVLTGEYLYLPERTSGKVFVVLRAYADVGKPALRQPPARARRS